MCSKGYIYIHMHIHIVHRNILSYLYFILYCTDMHCNSLMAWSPWQSPSGLHEAISRAVGAMAASMGISFVCLAKVYSDMR